MDPPCHIVTKLILPNLKRELARDLYAQGRSQAEISRKLSVSQAMVSKYLDEGEEPALPEGLGAEVGSLKNELAGLLETDAPPSDTVLAVCQGCFRLRESGLLCTLHAIENCNACTRLRYGDLTEDKRAVVEDIREALKLMESKDVSPLAPQVNMNIAQAARGAANTMDVASIPGRIAFVRGRPRAPLLPEFGVSRHLAGLLLAVMGTDPGTRAVVNIKLDRDVEEAVVRTGLRSRTLDRAVQDLFDLAGALDGAAVILDPGDFGIEPCTYVLGSNAIDAVKKVIIIMGEYKNGKGT
jgi:predicted fused transcriptional regulator/phosphomethylpyrimidine kinase/predicted transcriptional regulator